MGTVDERVYWIWAQQAFKPGSRMPMRLAGQFPGGLCEFYEGGPRLWNSRRDLKDSETAVLRDFSLTEAEARLEYAQKVGWQVLTPQSSAYPELLRNIPAPPAVLYGKGDLSGINSRLTLAVVGSRKALPVSVSAAGLFGYQLAAAGACVVSGGAIGVDSAALTGAMRVPGAYVVSVLPVSLDSGYLPVNARLRSMICSHGGALLTEYFSQTNPEPGGFHVRNRLITGLSRGVVIVQAGQTGGGLIYASHALDQDRDVFVYPGPAGAEQFAGSRRLLAEGAKAVTSGEDVLEEYDRQSAPSGPDPAVAELFRDLVLKTDRAEESPAEELEDVGAGLPPSSRRVLEALGGEPQAIAQLEEKTGLSPSALLGILTELEIDGLARSLPGKRYVRER